MITALTMTNSGDNPAGAEEAAAVPARVWDRSPADSCRYCRASTRPDFNYCSHCGMPIDPAHDRPLFVVEGLSNLFNVVFFESLLEQELNRASRYQHDLSVVVAEIDSLAELEAALGYELITNAIREVGNLIAGVLREADTLASTNRVTALGTQRFLILLPETDEEGAFRTAERIREMVGTGAVELGDGGGQVTLSMGVASTGKDPTADANLMGRATQALIESRARGQNRVQVAG
jgi:diguanylate cyclase (GGDEF)-like protein